MKKGLFRKGLVLGIIFLFVGTSVIPSTGYGINEKSNHPISDGNTLYVGGSGANNYTKIQDAINDANDGDTVFVYDDSSPYYERLRIRKSINLIGENRDTTIIDGTGTEYYYVVNIYHDWVNLSGFTIQNGDLGIVIYTDSNSTTISNNIIMSNNWTGINIHSDFCTISNNIIKNNNHTGIFISSDFNIIKKNTIMNHYDGIKVGHYDGVPGDVASKGNTIMKNNFINNNQSANFFSIFPYRNRFKQNYWGEPRYLPMMISGYIYLHLFKMVIPWFNIDWRPARKPYNIEE